MRERIKQIIDAENKKVPLTDEQIARQLKIRRDEVTLLRHELQIPDSRKRRYPLLIQEMQQLLQHDPKMTGRELTGMLNEMGYEVSKFTVHQLRTRMQAFSSGGSIAPAAANPNRTRAKVAKASPAIAFATMIGAKGTLKTAIQQAQAAVLYPPNGLHTLFFGATGVGKSHMAEAMYQFAIEQQVMKSNAPFIVFNCADYANNPQLLLSQLFGYVKGAFTGAHQDKPGLVMQADGGILFLDEIHRLPPEGQENLFYLIDKGIYRRLGEVQFQQKANILIVGATTESPESSLLLTLRRRIPMTIELPSLADWTLRERLALIFHFFNEEADRIGRDVVVQKEVIVALLTYECPGNTGQLHSDIRVLLAKAFLKTIHQEERAVVQADRHDMPMHVIALQQTNRHAEEMSMLKKEQYLFIPGQRHDLQEWDESDFASEHLYSWVVDRYHNLKKQGQSEELIQLIVGKELDARLEPSSSEHEDKRSARQQPLIKLVGQQVVQLVEQMLWIAERHMTLDVQRISYALAIHLRGLIDRLPELDTLTSGGVQVDPDTLEYKVAIEMAKVVQTMLDVQLPEQEISFLAIYLRQCSVLSEPRPLIGLVIVSYGQVAKSMADVGNRLFEKKHALAVELYWNDPIPQAIERIGQAIRQADQGRGVILLADMGCSMMSEAEWERAYGVRVKVLAHVTTTLVVEVLRKCLYASDELDQLVKQIRILPDNTIGSAIASVEKPVAIITICLTGEGAAKRLSMLLKEKLAILGDGIVLLSASSLLIRKTFKEWRKKYHVLAVVGTVDPLLEGIPFVSVKEIADESGISFIKRLLSVARSPEAAQQEKSSYQLRDLIFSELIFEQLAANTKEEAIGILAARLHECGFVEAGFLEKLQEREQLGHTSLLGVAIPHADTLQTIRPGIAVAGLVKPIEWEPGVQVRYIFMLAITEQCQPAVEGLYHFLHERSEDDAVIDFQAFMNNSLCI